MDGRIQPMNKLSSAKRALVISLLSEGTPINATERILKVSKRAILRVIRETGAALADYMDKNFRNLAVDRLALDEQWQYVGKHGQRMMKKESERGDFWMWAGIDSDTKLVVSHKIGRRDWDTSEVFIEDLASRITGPVQIATDEFHSYVRYIPVFFGERGEFSYATEHKIFGDARAWHPERYPHTRKNGIPKIVTADRKAVYGNPDLKTATTCHIERLFLTVRQELKRFQRLGLGYSKKLGMHKLATAMHIGVYNLCRKHSGINGLTPAMAAQITGHRWTIEEVVALTDRFLRDREDAKFARAWEAIHKN